MLYVLCPPWPFYFLYFEVRPARFVFCLFHIKTSYFATPGLRFHILAPHVVVRA